MDLTAVTGGQLRAASALVAGERARTYREATAVMGVHVGTQYTHLHRLRLGHPEVYAAFMNKRVEHLAARDAAAAARKRVHSRAWFRRKYNWRYWERVGY